MPLSIPKTVKKTDLKFVPFYPFLFSLYPALALLAFNISEVEAAVIWRPLAVSLAGTFLLLLLLRLLLRDWQRAALGAALLLFLFFSYGHIYGWLKSINLSGFVIGRHRFLLPLWLALGGLSLWWAARRVRSPRAAAPALNLISVLLLIYPVFQTSSYLWQEAQARRAAAQAAAEEPIPNTFRLGYKPDIYYIILDAYARADLLRTVYDYDNAPFLGSLEAMGFYVADCARSNYSQSMLSIPSSLNFDYLTNLSDQLVPGSTNRAPLRTLGQDNAARRLLESQGYTTVSFATSFPASEWKDADYFIEPPPQGMNEFEIMLLETSAGRAALDLISEPTEERTADWYRRRTLFTFQALEEEVPRIPGPKFVFAHVVIPHHPFVFGANGEPIQLSSSVATLPDYETYLKGYRDHVTYANKRVEQIVRIILETSPNPPIIVIQADHGPAPWDIYEHRMYILNAYYFPDGPDGLYPTITPVNTFRLIFNNYFGQDFELLEDVAYYSEYGDPYSFVTMPNNCADP